MLLSADIREDTEVIDAPKEEEEFKTLVLVVRIEFESELDAPVTTVVSVAS